VLHPVAAELVEAMGCEGISKDEYEESDIDGGISILVSDLWRLAGLATDVASISRFGEFVARNVGNDFGSELGDGEVNGRRFLSNIGRPQPHFVQVWPMCCLQISRHTTSSLAKIAQARLTWDERQREKASR
jgi:hypothetical protein